MALAPGERLGRYDILGRLGSGGMGIVYRAFDPTLGRQIALKVLPPLLSTNPAILTRFEQEARSASALNHPNIVTIYEIGIADSHQFIAMELVAGESLQAHLKRGLPALKEAVPILIQIVSALAAAHAGNIIHRDLKPENVMITPDGLVKLLDFGIAKLVAPLAPPGATAEAPGPTLPGFIVGTPGYMSPEQASAAPVDFRSDQFSFGSLAFEVLTGRKLFDRGTAVPTMAAILRDEPSFDQLEATVPEPLRWILEKCLAKKPEDRYASTRDLLKDLERVRELLHRDSLLVMGNQTRQLTANLPAFSWLQRRPWKLGAGLAAALLLAWGLGQALAAPSVPVVRHLTYSGFDRSPALSPDGKLMAFSSERNGGGGIWIKDLAGGAEVALTSGPDVHPRFLRDGSSLLFTRIGKNHHHSLFRIPTVGGEARRVLDDAERADPSPDGLRLVFLRPLIREGSSRFDLLVSGLDGSAPKRIHTEPGAVVSAPRWSPDGSRIAFASSLGTFGNPWTMVVIEARTLKVERIPPPSRAGGLSAVAWSRDGRSLVYAQTSSVLPGITSGLLLRHDLRFGRSVPLLSSLNLGDVIELSDPSRLVWEALASRQSLLETAFVRTDLDASQWLTRGQSIDRQPAYFPDGRRIVFSSNREGNLDLWELQLGTGALRRLTDHPAEDWDPFLSADGRNLLWSSRRSGQFQIWMAAADGSNPRKVTSAERGAENPSMTPDGQWIVYGCYQEPDAGVWKIRADGSAATRLAAGTVGSPMLSPDGRHVLFIASPPGGDSELRVIELATGKATAFSAPLVQQLPALGYLLGRCQWTRDGRKIVWVGQDDQGRTGLFIQDFEAGRATRASRRPLFGFDSRPVLESFALSPDGSRMIVAYRESSSNIVVAEGVAGVS
jgi:Tol biopolymer transport system component/serine/threonine protein kinase